MLVRFLVSWVFNTVALFVAAAIFRGISYGDDWWVLILAGAVFSAANLIVRPFVTFLAIPLIIITLGIALFFVNLLMLYLTSWIVQRLPSRGLLDRRRRHAGDLVGEPAAEHGLRPARGDRPAPRAPPGAARELAEEVLQRPLGRPEGEPVPGDLVRGEGGDLGRLGRRPRLAQRVAAYTTSITRSLARE